MSNSDPEKRREYARNYYAQKRAHDPEWWEKRKADQLRNHKSRMAKNPKYIEKCRTWWRNHDAGLSVQVPRLDLESVPPPIPKVELTPEERAARDRERMNAWRKTPKGIRCVVATWLKKKYGITLEDYEALYQNQSGRCAICGSEGSIEGKANDRLQVDHCHTTNRVRGLLCWSCNVGLGHFRDNPDLLGSALDYLNLQPRQL